MDLVLQVSEEDFWTLARLYPQIDRASSYGETRTRKSLNIRVDSLNLIVFKDSESYQAWKDATEVLKAQKPVDRAHAVKTIDGLLKLRGLR